MKILKMMNKRRMLLLVGLVVILAGVVFANTSEPDRFMVRFNDAYLVFTPGSMSMQVAAEGVVLSYGRDWIMKKMKPYLYHIKNHKWNFYWKVNTSRREVYRIRNGQFGSYGGDQEKLPVNLDVIGGNSNGQPERFFIRFTNAYLVYVPTSKTLQIVAQNNVISYGADWLKKNMKPYLFHLKKNSWVGFYWQVNTSRKELYQVKNGNFGTYGGNSHTINTEIDVVY